MNATFIRNCNFILKCPAYWDELGPTDQEGVRYCGACERKVFSATLRTNCMCASSRTIVWRCSCPSARCGRSTTCRRWGCRRASRTGKRGAAELQRVWREWVWDNSAMENFSSSLKTERTARKVYRLREQAKSDVFDYVK